MPISHRPSQWIPGTRFILRENVEEVKAYSPDVSFCALPSEVLVTSLHAFCSTPDLHGHFYMQRINLET